MKIIIKINNFSRGILDITRNHKLKFSQEGLDYIQLLSQQTYKAQ